MAPGREGRLGDAASAGVLVSDGWRTSGKDREAPPRQPATPLGCETCRGQRQPLGWIQWDIYLGPCHQRLVVTRCHCNGGQADRPSLGPGESCEVHHVRISETARAAAEASWARRGDPAALDRALGRRGPAQGVTNKLDKLRSSNWGQVFAPENERPRGPG